VLILYLSINLHPRKNVKRKVMTTFHTTSSALRLVNSPLAIVLVEWKNLGDCRMLDKQGAEIEIVRNNQPVRGGGQA
jgi:hypothetical protein